MSWGYRDWGRGEHFVQKDGEVCRECGRDTAVSNKTGLCRKCNEK